jgi:hypothetical protein
MEVNSYLASSFEPEKFAFRAVKAQVSLSYTLAAFSSNQLMNS